MIAHGARMSRRRGITLTEILISIMILGVGLVSLATLFPIALLRLRDATRSTRTAYLTESACADVSARGLLTESSFPIADSLNLLVNPNAPPSWYFSVTLRGTNFGYQAYDPTAQDTPSYLGNIYDPNNAPPNQVLLGLDSTVTSGYGLPFAYDPLFRFQTPNGNNGGASGYYLNDPNGSFEARFGSGIGYIRQDPVDTGLPSAHGLQRLTNFNRPAVMPSASNIPYVFVSQEDVVWVEALPSNAVSPVLPDMSLKFSAGSTVNDWKYSWMFTGYKISSAGGSSFEGSVVIFENRPFGIEAVTNPPGPGLPGGGNYQVAGETVVEAIWGHSGNVVSVAGGAPGFGAGADRTVLLRWYASQPDPVVKPGDWIADVTYERQFPLVASRFLSFNNGNGVVGGLQNITNNLEWDNLPAQRCFWYQVQKVTAPIDDPYTNVGLRSMVVYVDRTLNARTVLNAVGQPLHFDAALISPYVVNVIPQTFFQ